MLEAQLKEVPFFKSLGKKELRAVAQQTDEVDVPEGKELATEGDFGHEFFIIEKGTADVTQRGEKVRELGPGDFFGELSIFDSETRSATVVATEDTELLTLGRVDLVRIVSRNPDMALALLRSLSARLRVADDRLASPPPVE